MGGNGTDQTERLILRSRLSDLAQVPAWVDGLAARHSISANAQFAIDLCLEETLSNIIRHGYAGAEDCSLSLSFAVPYEGTFELAVEDEAPGFNPLDAPEQAAMDTSDDMPVGGQGIRLVRQFADRIEYQRLPKGNRLRMWFSNAGAAVRAK